MRIGGEKGFWISYTCPGLKQHGKNQPHGNGEIDVPSVTLRHCTSQVEEKSVNPFHMNDIIVGTSNDEERIRHLYLEYLRPT